MNIVKVYHYPQCSTCKKALTFLNKQGVKYEAVNIVEQPPTISELRVMLTNVGDSIQKLYNTSGQLYREMNIKQLLPSLTIDQSLLLLSQHGKLIKRPFILINGEQGMVGFDENTIRKLLHQ